jgi:tetratricopeptide (TPR) repeat protein
VVALALACACQRNAERHLTIADGLLARGAPELAVTEYLEALRLEPSLRAERGAGLAYLALDDLERAEQHLRLALSVQPGDIEARLALIELHGLNGRGDEAKKELAILREDQPDHRGALLLVGGYAQTPSEVRRSIIELEREVERQKARETTVDRELQILLADLYAREGKGELSTSYQRGARLATLGSELQTLELGRVCVQERRFALAYDLLQAVLEKRSTEADAWQLFAQAALELGYVPEARAAIANIPPRAQERPAARLLRARGALAADFQVAAERELNELVDVTSVSVPRLLPAVRLALAQTLIAQQRLDDARTLLERLIQDNPGALEARVRLARLELDRGRAEQAARSLTPLPPAHAELGAASDILGRAQLALGDSAGAEQSFRQVVSLAPERPEGRYGVARALLLRGEQALARPLLEDNLQRFPAHRPSLLALAELIKRSEGAPGAESFMMKYWAAHAGSAEVATLEGDWEYARQQPTRALAAYRRAATLAPDHLPAVSALARFYARRMLAQQAFAVLDAALLQSPRSSKLLMLAAEVASDLRDYPQAGKQLARLFAIVPDYPPALAFQARLGAESGGDLAAALRLAERARAAAPGNADVLDALGWVSHLAGDHRGAVARLTQVVSIEPNDPRNHYQLAVAALAGGDSAVAQKSLAQTFALDAAFPDSAGLRSRLGLTQRADAAPAQSERRPAP